MSKIVQAVNAMLQHPENISKVIATAETGTPEYYFLYKNYKWSILYYDTDKSYNLFYYPGDRPIEEVATLEFPESATFITYRSKDIGTKEAIDSFKELYQVIQAKLYHVDEVLDDIINDEVPF